MSVRRVVEEMRKESVATADTFSNRRANLWNGVRPASRERQRPEFTDPVQRRIMARQKTIVLALSLLVLAGSLAAGPLQAQQMTRTRGNAEVTGGGFV